MQHTKEVLIGVGLTIAIAVIAGAIMGGSSISQAQSESLEIVTVELKKGSGSTALLSVKIKNAGNSPLSSVNGQLNFDTDGATIPIDPYTFVFTPTDLEPGAVTVFVGDVTGSSIMSMGESFTLFVNGTTLQGSTIQDTAVASVSRF
jgi:hypothetical protein